MHPTQNAQAPQSMSPLAMFETRIRRHGDWLHELGGALEELVGRLDGRGHHPPPIAVKDKPEPMGAYARIDDALLAGEAAEARVLDALGMLAKLL